MPPRGFGFMQDEQATLETNQQQAASAHVEPQEQLIQDHSSPPSDANSILNIELQANQLFHYIDKLSSFADRACKNAINQTERVQRFEESYQIELINLRRQEPIGSGQSKQVESNAAKELEIGKLIKRLSTECEKLNIEKTRRIAQLEGEKIQPAKEVKAWRQVVGRIQEEPT